MKIFKNIQLSPGEKQLRIKGLEKIEAVYYNNGTGANIGAVVDSDENAEVKEYYSIVVRPGAPVPSEGEFIGVGFFAMAPNLVYFLTAEEYEKELKNREEQAEKEAEEKKKAAEKEAEAVKKANEKKKAAAKSKSKKKKEESEAAEESETTEE